MSDRPVPGGEPGQTPGWPPQQAPAGGAAPAPGVPPQASPSGAFGPAPSFGPPPAAPGAPVPAAPQVPQPPQPQPTQPQGQPVPQPQQPQPVQPQPVGPTQAQPVVPQPQPQQPWQQATLPSPPAGTPDWEALANRNEADAKKKRRMRMIIAVATVVVLAGGTAAGLVLLKDNSGTPSANGSPTASASGGATGSPKSPAPTASGTPKSIPGPATVGSIPAAKGTVALGLGSDAKQGTMPGYPGQVLKLPSGQNSFAQSADQVVDTDKSFTVSARVFVDVPTGNRSAVSQGDGPYYSYSLGRAAAPDGRNLWYFKVQLPGGGSAVAWSKGEAPVNQWALLTGVYDAAAGQITLYINGAAQSAEKAAGVKASGADTLQIGRLSSNSQWSDPWHGAVADIQTWSQVLPEADIVKIVAGPSSPPSLPPAAAWLTG